MIRRLQPEPPKVETAAQKTDKSKDSTEQESLALEFKKLLERARGGIRGAQDEVVALGLALAQAVSTVKTQQVEIRKEADAHDTGDVDDGATFDDGVVEAQVTDQEGQSVVVAKSGRVGPERVDVQDEGPEIQDEGPSEDGDGPLLDDSGEEIVLDEEVIFTDLTELVEEQTLDTGTENVVEDSVTYARQASDGEGEIQLDEGFEQVEAEIFEGPIVKRARDTGDTEEEEAQFYDEEEEFLSGVESPGVLQGPIKNVARGSKKEGEISPDINVVSDADNRIEEDSPSQSLARDWFEPRWMNGVGNVARNAKDNDPAARGERREQPAALNFDLPFGAAGPMREKNGELFLQVTLLRQAYESLKSQTNTGQDLRARNSSGVAAGVNSAQQTKTTDTDTSPRQARYLNKAANQRMLERVESALKEAARTRDGKTISLKLDPANLGQVKVDVSLRDGALHARVTPQNKEVLQSLREHAHELQGALRRLGLNVERVSVQVIGETFQQSMQDARGPFDGKSFQQERNNMPGKDRQAPENTFGNEFADVPRAGVVATTTGKADHWIA